MRFSDEEIRAGADKLRPYLLLVKTQQEGEYAYILSGKEPALAQYGPLFRPERISTLTAEEFRGFLMYRNNRHWRSLQRMGPAQTADMPLLRKALTTLLDESKPLRDRLDILLPSSVPMVPRLGAATITPILHISQPDNYCVLNKPAEDALRKIGLWPEFHKDAPFSDRYIEVNEICLALSKALSIDLWTLDTVWWAVLLEEFKDDPDSAVIDEEPLPAIIEEAKPDQRFGMERYLQEFLRDNWDTIHDFRDWRLHEEDGDIVGFEYNTNEVGRIDLLAHHKSEPKWLVIELKRNQSSDQTVGQVLRYIGWVEDHLKQNGESVLGVIISHEADTAIKYALHQVPCVELMLYDVRFTLRHP